MRILPYLTFLCFVFSACEPNRTNINSIHRDTGIRLPNDVKIKPAVVIGKVDTSVYAVIPYDPKDIFMLVVDTSRKCRPAKLTSKEIDTMETYIIGALNERAKDTNMLQPQDLSTYRRQYIAYYNSKGQKEVWVNFFCDKNDEGWRNSIVMVMDGGPCFFNLTINLATHVVYSVSVNGYA